MKIINVCSALGIIIVLCGGCTVDASAPEEGRPGTDPESPAESGENVGETQEALGVRRLSSHTERYFGGDLFPKHHRIVVGSRCSPGFERSPSRTAAANPAVTWIPSAGSTGGNCNFESWLAPDDPFDCRANIHAFTEAAGGQVTCFVDVYEERSNRTCTDGRTSNRCGGLSVDRSCFCDPECERYGDCCSDYTRVCFSP